MLSSELHIYKQTQPGSAPMHSAFSLFHPVSSSASATQISQFYCTEQSRYVSLQETDFFRLSSNLACQGNDYSWLLHGAGQSFRILVCVPKPQRVLELASVCSRLGETATGKLENSGKHLTSFYSWLRN